MAVVPPDPVVHDVSDVQDLEDLCLALWITQSDAVNDDLVSDLRFHVTTSQSVLHVEHVRPRDGAPVPKDPVGHVPFEPRCDLGPWSAPADGATVARAKGDEMAEITADETIEHHLFERPLPYCPSCGSRSLVALSRDGNVDYLCRRCSSCWHVELGAFWRVEN
jgi:hypothetical protein